jgi:hypothetical protein
MQEHFCLADGVSQLCVQQCCTKGDQGCLQARLLHIYYHIPQAGVEAEDETHAGARDLPNQGPAPSREVDWLVKDPEAWDWLYGLWAYEDFRVIAEQN